MVKGRTGLDKARIGGEGMAAGVELFQSPRGHRRAEAGLLQAGGEPIRGRECVSVGLTIKCKQSYAPIELLVRHFELRPRRPGNVTDALGHKRRPIRKEVELLEELVTEVLVWGRKVKLEAKKYESASTSGKKEKRPIENTNPRIKAA